MELVCGQTLRLTTFARKQRDPLQDQSVPCVRCTAATDARTCDVQVHICVSTTVFGYCVHCILSIGCASPVQHFIQEDKSHKCVRIKGSLCGICKQYTSATEMRCRYVLHAQRAREPPPTIGLTQRMCFVLYDALNKRSVLFGSTCECLPSDKGFSALLLITSVCSYLM
jgi:hypothetical protein